MLTQFLHLFSFNSIGQVLYGISGLVIVKFISIQDYGIAACVLAFTNFCSLIAAGRYDVPILYEKNEDKRRGCIKLCCVLIPLVSVVCCLVGFFLRRLLFKGLSVDFLVLLVFFVLMANRSFFELVVRKIYIHTGKFNQLSYLLFSDYLLRSFLPFFLLIFWDDWRCCIFGETIAVSAVCSVFILKNIELKAIKLDFKSVMGTLRAYKHYPKYQLPSTVLDSISFASLIPMLNFLFGNAVAGQFSLVYRILLVPLSLLGRIIGDFYQHSISIAIKCKELSKILSQYTKTFFLCSVFIYSTISLGVLISCKTGNNFGEYSYLWPVLIQAPIQFVVSSLSGVLLVNISGVKYKMFYDCFNYILVLSTFFVTYWAQLDHYACIRLLVCSLVGAYIVYYFLIYYYVRNFRYTDN